MLVYGYLALVVFKNLQIFDINNLILLLDVNSINCMAIISNKNYHNFCEFYFIKFKSYFL